MITKFKIYEVVYEPTGNDSLKKGNYVICEEPAYPELFNFLNNNIGEVINFSTKQQRYSIRYEDVPNNLFTYFYKSMRKSGLGGHRYFNFSDIKYYSDNKEELELLLQTKKYNL